MVPSLSTNEERKLIFSFSFRRLPLQVLEQTSSTWAVRPMSSNASFSSFHFFVFAVGLVSSLSGDRSEAEEWNSHIILTSLKLQYNRSFWNRPIPFLFLRSPSLAAPFVRPTVGRCLFHFPPSAFPLSPFPCPLSPHRGGGGESFYGSSLVVWEGGGEVEMPPSFFRLGLGCLLLLLLRCRRLLWRRGPAHMPEEEKNVF